MPRTPLITVVFEVEQEQDPPRYHWRIVTGGSHIGGVSVQHGYLDDDAELMEWSDPSHELRSWYWEQVAQQFTGKSVPMVDNLGAVID